ncbi:MAG: hypothetical protein KBF76_20600 [Verrucomicrobiales bacterium]|nr:hypothetical protein [Verrucomicrobiales bacterium]
MSNALPPSKSPAVCREAGELGGVAGGDERLKGDKGKGRVREALVERMMTLTSQRAAAKTPRPSLPTR